jgi:MFS family permease
MAGRFLTGFGGAIAISSAIIYVTEMAHPSYRGTLVGVFNAFYYIGQLPGTWIPYACANIEGTQSWRIPLWLQIVYPGIILLYGPFLPETPRWLIANDRESEALDVMVSTTAIVP